MDYDAAYLEMMLELPVMTSLACFIVGTIEPFRSRTFIKRLSPKLCIVLVAAAVLAIAGGIVRICTVNSQHVPLILTMLAVGPLGLAIGCGVVLVLRGLCPGFLKRDPQGLLLWLLPVFAVVFFVGAGWAALEGEGTAAAVFAGFGALELLGMVGIVCKPRPKAV